MPVARLAIVTPLVELPRSKVHLVSVVGAYEAGRWIDSGEAAHELGLSPARCRQLLRELADARVILRDGGGGGRRFWCEVNPDVFAWRVEWRVSRHELADRLARHDALVATGPIRRFIARPMYARCGDAIARLWSARSAFDDAAEVLVSAPSPTPSTPGSRGQGRAMRRRLSIVPTRAMIGGRATGGVSTSGGASNGVPPGGHGERS
jgi:hypothetical protein